MRANAPELPRPTESSEQAISTETNVDGGTVTGSWGKSLGWAAPEGQGPITYGHAMPRAERPRQWGEDFGEASPPGLALRERQVVGPESPGFSPASQCTSARAATSGVRGPRPQPHSIGTTDAARAPRAAKASTEADPSVSQGPDRLPWESAPSHRFLHTAAPAARPASPAKAPSGSGSGRPATTTAGVGARGTSGRQAHKSPSEGLMRRLWEVVLLSLLLASPAAGKKAKLV